MAVDTNTVKISSSANRCITMWSIAD